MIHEVDLGFLRRRIERVRLRIDRVMLDGRLAIEESEVRQLLRDAETLLDELEGEREGRREARELVVFEDEHHRL